MGKIIESDCGNITTLADDAIPNEVTITNLAKTKITEVLELESDESFLRIVVDGGGCAGFQYRFGIHDEIEDDDIVNEWDGGKLVIDSMSMTYMKGSTIGFEDSFGGEHFSVNNPESSSECGCGSSFGMDMDY